jgi:hypothetical protein
MLTRNEQILLILILFIFIYFTWKINNLDNKNIEKYTDDNTPEDQETINTIEDQETINTTEDQEYINTLVKKIYLSDVEAIRILSNFAIQLSQGGIIVPNNINFRGLTINDNISSSGNISTNNNINVGGNINVINNISTTDITINGTMNATNDIIGKKNITGNIITANNINTNKNITANNITISGNINTNKNITVINGAGIIKCNELVCPKIGGGSGIGAWLINKNNSSFPIMSSIFNYTTLGINNINAIYIVMPGYKLEVYSNNTKLLTIDNTTFTEAKLKTSTTTVIGSSCKLYYNNFVLDDLYISNQTQY